MKKLPSPPPAFCAALCARLFAIPIVRLASLSALAPLALAAALLAIPVGEARAHDDNSAMFHADTYPLQEAAEAGDLDSVNHFIAVHGADVNMKNKYGYTPLPLSASHGHAIIVATLIAAGADVNVKNKHDEETPLHIAARNGHVSVISVLIAARADINAENSRYWTPLHIAAQRGHVSVVSALIAAGADVSSVWAYAAGGQYVSVISTLIAAEAGTNAIKPEQLEQRDSDGRTMLHKAAGANNVVYVRGLVRMGANVNALDSNSKTPLHHAAIGNAAEAVADLAKSGANLEAKEARSGMTPLHRAALDLSLDAFVALLDSGANIEAQSAKMYGVTPMHIVAERGASEMADELVKRGANINAVDRDGHTPIEYAIANNHFALADKLQALAQQAREIPQESPKSTFPTAKTEAGGVFETTWRSVVVVEAGNSQGSGVALKPNVVATNCHVTDAATSPIAIYKGENRRAEKSKSYPARVIAGDRRRDVCLLAVEGLWAIPAETRNATEMRIAEQVYAVGAPRGLDFSISGGLVSQLREEDEEGRKLSGNAPLIQTDTAISPGSSGGGLFDAKGKLVGLTTFGYRDSEGLNFAVPIEWALELIPDAEQ